MRRGGIAALLAVVVLAALPAVLSSYAITVFIFIFFYAYLGQAWNIVGGYAGQLSAGHAAFVGVGAYTSAMLSMTLGLTPWIGMFVGGLLSAALGALIGFLGFRFGLRGFYFVLLTVAFAEICRIVALNTDAVGGALGLYIGFTGNPRQFQFQDNRAYYYVALALMLAATGLVAALERRRFGEYLRAIREPARRSASTPSSTRCWPWCCRPSSPGSAGPSTPTISSRCSPTRCSASRSRWRSSSGPSWVEREPCWGPSSARSS
jgi:branched-chain amino acid transport system permease protein